MASSWTRRRGRTCGSTATSVRFWVSVDAARQDTYEVVRRGGSFDRLCRNLDFLGGLRAERRIDLLRLDFVVQALNFREMPEFVEWAP